jgi:hypothetical protein
MRRCAARHRGDLPSPIADIEGGAFSPHQHSFRRFGQLQNGVRGDRVASAVCVSGINVELPDGSNSLAVQDRHRKPFDVCAARVHKAAYREYASNLNFPLCLTAAGSPHQTEKSAPGGPTTLPSDANNPARGLASVAACGCGHAVGKIRTERLGGTIDQRSAVSPHKPCIKSNHPAARGNGVGAKHQHRTLAGASPDKVRQSLG